MAGSAILEMETDLTRAKTVWKRARHDAGWGGRFSRDAEALNARAFDFSKSLYAVRDALAPVIGNKRDAIVLDFFAGSGTTAHAEALLNRADGGRRITISITNNEVGALDEKRLRECGWRAGDPEGEQRGIFHSVTVPRVTAALTGIRVGVQSVGLGAGFP
jgi:adenine-specific DNA-methyltransferase